MLVSELSLLGSELFLLGAAQESSSKLLDFYRKSPTISPTSYSSPASSSPAHRTLRRILTPL